MHTDKYGQQLFSENDLFDAFMRDPQRIINNALVQKGIVFDDTLSLSNIPSLIEYNPVDVTLNDFDSTNQSVWYLPTEYVNMDIAKWVIDKCATEEELQRTGQELLEFQKRDMFMLLKYLKYLVDIMREHNIVWGVGRGSSVASFVLFLIGIHKINSLYYGLSIEEFLK
jgi:DNA polymerase III alpha subunit